ncbi:MAG: HAD family phosphatase [Bacteroidetes bacterium]|nr:HAD family phosphatase [Bacteroidota bacterium]
MSLIKSDFKNIIFDLGGVILNIDYNLTINAFNKLGIEDFDQIYSKAQQDNLFDQYEIGKISSPVFINEIITRCNKNISGEDVTAAWNAMLLDLPKERLALLEKLKSRYRTFLLSNTNDIHITAYGNYLNKTFGFRDLSNYFEQQYLSFQVGMRKPHVEIFQHVLSQNNLKAEETIFIDDSIQHIEGAKQAGITALHLTGGKTILDLFL